jgi:hypothetical protein
MPFKVIPPIALAISFIVNVGSSTNSLIILEVVLEVVLLPFLMLISLLKKMIRNEIPNSFHSKPISG